MLNKIRQPIRLANKTLNSLRKGQGHRVSLFDIREMYLQSRPKGIELNHQDFQRFVLLSA